MFSFLKPKGEKLLTACNDGNLKAVASILKVATAADVNYTDKEGSSPLLHAAYHDHLDIVVALLAHPDVDVKLKDKRGDTALLCACNKGNLSIMDALLKHPGVDVNATHKDGDTALMSASYKGHLEVAKLLLAHPGVDVNLQHKVGLTPLIYASVNGHLEIVKLLLVHPDVDVNLQNKVGLTPLINASGNCHLEVVKLLLARPDVNVNLQNKDGETALMCGAENSHLEIVKLLMAYPGVDVNLQNKHGRTALDIAKTEEIKSLLSPLRTAPSENPTLESCRTNHDRTDEDKDTEFTNHLDVSVINSSRLPLRQQQDLLQKQEQQQEVKQKVLTDQDRAAFESFLATYTPAVNEMAGLLAAHDRALHVLVNKQKECPSLFWFYPKKRELRNWLGNPLKCLLQDSLMMMVVCPVTLCVVKCGPDGVGWEIRSPKAWVKKWGPAILASIYVMQAAVLAGRIVGIPLPTLPCVGEMTNVLGLHVGGGVWKDGMSAVTNHVSAENLMNSLQGFASVTEQCLEEHKSEMGCLIHKMQLQQEQQRRQRASNGGKSGAPSVPPEEITLGADMPTAMIGASYHSIHTFLTTGENAMLGKLEDQLRGSMERVMAEDGEVEWVSVQAVDAWKQMHSAVKVPSIPSPYTAPSSNRVVSIPPTISTVVSSSWLAVRLRAKGTKDESIVLCERILIDEEEYSEEHLLGSTPHTHFTFEYLHSIGITARGLQQKLISIHRELTVEYQATSPAPVSPFSPDSAASFTSDEKDAVQRELASLKSELSEMKSKSGKNAFPVPNQVASSNGSGGGSGLKLKQRNEASTINPLTGQEYSMDELILKVATLEANVSSAQRDIGHLGSVVQTHDVDLEDLKGTTSHTKSNPVSSLPSQEHTDQKNDLLRKY